MTQTTELVDVRFTRPYQGYRSGQVVPVTKGYARTLEVMGRAVRVEHPLLEVAVAPQPVVERATAPAARAPRRRRKA